MKCEFSCKDKLWIHKKRGKKTEEEAISLEVQSGNTFGRSVIIDSDSYNLCGRARIPVEVWAEVKDTVDRLIIRLENLERC